MDGTVSLISEMLTNIKNCPKEKCGACSKGVDVALKSLNQLWEAYCDQESQIKKLKKKIPVRVGDHYVDPKEVAAILTTSQDVRDKGDANQSTAAIYLKGAAGTLEFNNNNAMSIHEQLYGKYA